MNTPKSIVITGRRWFDKKYGNTYFSARAYVDGKLAAEIPLDYGYGDAYLYEIARKLEDAGYMPDRKHYNRGPREIIGLYCERHNIALAVDVTDVNRKRDL